MIHRSLGQQKMTAKNKMSWFSQTKGVVNLSVLMKLLSLFFIFLLLAITWTVASLFPSLGSKNTYQVTNASITSIIRETPLKLLTNTTVTMVVCTFEDLPESARESFSPKLRDFFLGKTEAFFIAKVYYDFGIDLLEINEGNVDIGDDTITVTLPEPKLLRNSVDLESIKGYTKTTLLRTIWDTAVGREMMDELKKTFQQKAVEFARETGLESTKASIIKNIESFVNRIIATQTEKKVIFK
jgi:hypothetical protein